MIPEEGQAASCRMRRISDERYCALIETSYPIFGTTPAFSYFRRYCNVGESVLGLSEYFALMRVLFGDSGLHYDDWKGFFSFPFEIELLKGGACYPYVVNVINYRSAVELRFRKIVVGETNVALDYFRQPIEDELSRYEMELIDGFFYGLLQSRLKYRKFYEIPDFVRKIETQSLILGNQDGRFFQRWYEDGEKFLEEVRAHPGLTATAISEEKWPEADRLGWIDVVF